MPVARRFDVEDLVRIPDDDNDAYDQDTGETGQERKTTG